MGDRTHDSRIDADGREQDLVSGIDDYTSDVDRFMAEHQLRIARAQAHSVRTSIILRTDEDVDQPVDALLAESFDCTMAAALRSRAALTEQGYPDHDFRVGINGEQEMGSLKDAGRADGIVGAWYATVANGNTVRCSTSTRAIRKASH